MGLEVEDVGTRELEFAEQDNGLMAALAQATAADADAGEAARAQPPEVPAWQEHVPEKLLRGDPETTLLETSRAYREIEAAHTRSQQELQAQRRQLDEIIEQQRQERQLFQSFVEQNKAMAPAAAPAQQEADPMDELLREYSDDSRPMAKEVLTLIRKYQEKAMPKLEASLRREYQAEMEQQRAVLARIEAEREAQPRVAVVEQFFNEHPEMKTDEMRAELGELFQQGLLRADSPDLLRRGLELVRKAKLADLPAPAASQAGLPPPVLLRPPVRDPRQAELERLHAGGPVTSADRHTPNVSGAAAMPPGVATGDLPTLLEWLRQQGQLPE